MNGLVLEAVQGSVAAALDGVKRQFKPGAKITILVRFDDRPESDFCMTDDDLGEVAKMVERRREAAR